MAGKRKRTGKDGQNPGISETKRRKEEIISFDLASDPKPTFEKRLFVETLTTDERRREADLYDRLGSEDGEERIEAGETIISCLLEETGVSEAVLQRHLKKMMRGLSSGRIASRYGFSLVVTELLMKLFGDDDLAHKKYTGLTFDKVLGFLVHGTKPEGNISGQEERDHYLGLAFGLESFVKSQILLRDISRWMAILDVLLGLCRKKIWLRPQCGYVLVQVMEQMTEADTKTTLSKIAEVGMAKTPEGVAAWIVSLNRHPKLQVQPWENPLSNKSLQDLAAVLKESFKEVGKDTREQQDFAKQASWSAQLHFVWDIILARFSKPTTDKLEDDFEQFWNRVVDDGLFSRQATDGQKFKGFMVFQKMLEGFAERSTHLQQLFSRNFMTCLLNQAAKEDRYLHRAATKALKAIVAVVSEQQSSLPSILSNLLGKYGSYAFDQRTNSKTVDKLLQNTTHTNVDEVLAVIRKPLRNLNEKENPEAQLTLRTYAEYLGKVLNATSVEPGKNWDAQSSSSPSGPVLQELAALAYSQPKGISSEVHTDKIREMCRSRLESCLAKQARSSHNFTALCESISSIDLSTQSMSTEIAEAVTGALKRMKKLLRRKSTSRVEKDAAQALALLHATSIFQLFNEDSDAMEVLNDLSDFCDRLKPAKASKESLNHDQSSELLIEILLSMVAKPSSLTRQVSQQVFEAYTSQITPEGLDLLTEPLASGESTQGQEELFNTNEDEVDGGSDSSEGEGSDVEDVEDVSDFEMDSDLQFTGLKGDLEDDQHAEGEDKNGRSLELTRDVEWQDAQELDEKLGEILNSHRLDKDVEADSSSDEGEMSDSDMFALDEKLAAAIAPHLKHNKPNAKKAKKDAKQSVINFKHRILDLIETYMRNETLNALTLSILMPLLRLTRTTTAKSLAQKASAIILDYRKRLKKARSQARATTAGNSSAHVEQQAPGTGRAPAQLLSLLEEIHLEAGRDDSHAYARAASAASLIVASTVLDGNAEAMEPIVGVYAKTLTAWGMKRSKVQKLFFDDWITWTGSHAT